MRTLECIDVWNILEILFSTDNIDLIWYEQNERFVFIETLVEGKHIELKIAITTNE